jgi:predicted MFS family arabinose efflux permease
VQNTRLNQLLTASTRRLTDWFSQPWRRLSVQIIGLLAGFFLGSAISTTTGQAAQWDISVAAIIVIAIELLSWWVYRLPPPQSPDHSRIVPLGREVINCLKIGVSYSLVLEALKLGS